MASANAPARLVFSGSMDWHPNEDAVIYFADAILPRIRAEVPGRHRSPSSAATRPRACASSRRAPAIDVTGTVDDVRPSIGEAAVYVVPLRAGGGTRLKIFEALAMAKAGGVDDGRRRRARRSEPGATSLPADDPAAFADAVISLLARSRPAAARSGAPDALLVEAYYSWPTIAREFEDTL